MIMIKAEVSGGRQTQINGTGWSPETAQKYTPLTCAKGAHRVRGEKRVFSANGAGAIRRSRAERRASIQTSHLHKNKLKMDQNQLY